MKCVYHANHEAVNICSRCNNAICIECNYLTGTNPVCRNCWDKFVSSGRWDVIGKPRKIQKAKIQKAKIQKEHTEKEPIKKKDRVQVRIYPEEKKLPNKDITQISSRPKSAIDKAADGNKVQVRTYPEEKKLPNKDITQTSSRPKSAIDKAADGIEFGLDRIGDGIIFLIGILTSVLTWPFTIMRRKIKK